MPDREVRTYSAKEIERIAEIYLEGHFGSAIPVPVDVDFLVEKAEGIDLDFYPKLRANHGILGGVWRDVDTAELFIDADALQRWLEPVKKWLCKELASRFEVSEFATNLRLGEWPAKIYDRVERALDAGSDTLL